MSGSAKRSFRRFLVGGVLLAVIPLTLAIFDFWIDPMMSVLIDMFVYPGLLILGSCFLICAIVYAVRNRGEAIRTGVTVLIPVAAQTFICFAPIDSWYLDGEFRMYRQAREKIVADVESGKVVKDSFSIRVPANIGADEEAWVDGYKPPDARVEFPVWNGILGHASGWMWVPNDQPPKEDFEQNQFRQVIRKAPHWYWVVS